VEEEESRVENDSAVKDCLARLEQIEERKKVLNKKVALLHPTLFKRQERNAGHKRHLNCFVSDRDDRTRGNCGNGAVEDARYEATEVGARCCHVALCHCEGLGGCQRTAQGWWMCERVDAESITRSEATQPKSNRIKPRSQMEM
jgi:hypothetical protein